MLELGEFPSLDADNLPFAVHLSSVQTPQPSSENLCLIRYCGDLLGHLVSTLWECKSPELEKKMTGKLYLAKQDEGKVFVHFGIKGQRNSYPNPVHFTLSRLGCVPPIQRQ